MEMLCKLAGQFGGSRELLKRISDCVATEEAVRLLDTEEIKEPVMKEAARLVKAHMEAFGEHKVQVEVILFSNELGLLAKTEQAESFLES